MTSNEYDAMEWNDVLVEANNLTYYTHETELRMQRYDALNMHDNVKIFQDLGMFWKKSDAR